MSNITLEAMPVIETQPGTIDMTEFEAQINNAQAVQAAGEVAVHTQVTMEDEAEVEMVVGFNPNLLAMFLRATPGSELSNNLANLMVADMVVNNAVAYGLVEDQNRATENLYHYQQSKKAEGNDSEDADIDE